MQRSYNHVGLEYVKFRGDAQHNSDEPELLHGEDLMLLERR
jgi:hypothetical protein